MPLMHPHILVDVMHVLLGKDPRRPLVVPVNCHEAGHVLAFCRIPVLISRSTMVPSQEACVFRVHSRTSKTLFDARQEVPREHTERERAFLCGHGSDGTHTDPSRSITRPIGPDSSTRDGAGPDW